MSHEILIVDDSAFSRNLLSKSLAAAGYAVRVADNGNQALQMLQHGCLPALVLLDIHMPGMNGFEVCQQLKCHERTQIIPVIFMTAVDDDKAQDNAFEVGAADFITKPIQPRVLLARVKTHLVLHHQRVTLQGQLDNVVEQAPVPFLFADRAGRIVRTNTAAARKFGYPNPQTMLGLPLDDLVPLDTAEKDKTRTRPLLYPHIRYANVQCKRKDGHTFAAETNICQMDSPGGVLLMVVVQDISARQAALTSIGDSLDQIRQLAKQNELARESERKHIAREIHDELGQVLTALRLDISMLRMDHQERHPELVERFVQLRKLVDDAIARVRDIAGNLRPAALDVGLGPALEWLSTEFNRTTGIQCHLDISHPNLQLDEDRALMVYRILQESLTNVAKYASARYVNIQLQVGQQQAMLSIRDDGIGFQAEALKHKRTFGMLGMEERALALDGSVHIRSSPGQGCCVTLTFPIHTPDTGSEE